MVRFVLAARLSGLGGPLASLPEGHPTRLGLVSTQETVGEARDGSGRRDAKRDGQPARAGTLVLLTETEHAVAGAVGHPSSGKPRRDPEHLLEVGRPRAGYPRRNPEQFLRGIRSETGQIRRSTNEVHRSMFRCKHIDLQTFKPQYTILSLRFKKGMNQ